MEKVKDPSKQNQNISTYMYEIQFCELNISSLQTNHITQSYALFSQT